MKKICLIILAVIMLSCTVYAGDASETLSDLLKSDAQKAEKVVLSLADGDTVEVDKEKFFEISDSTVLTKNENAESAQFDGIYIHVYNTDESYTYAFVTKKGEVDVYSAFMSRYPEAKFQASENTFSELEKLTVPKKEEKDYKSEIYFLICVVIAAFIGLIIYNKKS